MSDRPGGGAAKRPRDRAAERQASRPPGSAQRPGVKKLRTQWHLGESLLQRLGVHCALAQRSQAAVVEEVLGNYLSRFGKGRELFDSGNPADSGTSEGQGDLAAPTV